MAKTAHWCLALLMVASACVGSSADVRVAVHPNHPGMYVIHFKYGPFVESYGPGWSVTDAALKRATTSVEVNDVWRDVLTESARRYLDVTGAPSDCRGGVSFVGAGVGEGGNGTVLFRCRTDGDN
jgi:hypothetical protein